MTISAVIFMSKEQFIHLLTLKNHFKVQIVIISELTKYLTKFTRYLAGIFFHIHCKFGENIGNISRDVRIFL